ncbi:MAG: BamA/TamA family outer membrane protein [Balneolaceae bacterium]|nr:BamA/TamA family outer membrane protein [Balneolaceae bacterium]
MIGISVYAYSPSHIGQAPDIPDQVWKIEIKGNEAFSDLVIKDQIATESPSFWDKVKFWNKGGHAINETELRKDVIRIRNYYNRRGYNKVRVSYRVEDGKKDWKKKVIFTIDENAPIRVNDVTYVIDASTPIEKEIRENDDYQAVLEKHAYRSGKRYQFIREPEVIGSFVDVLKNLGFAYAEVEITTKIDTSRLEANLTITSKPGPKTYIEKLEVEGAEKLPDDYVIRESALRTGDLYNYDEIQKAQQELFNHHMYRFVTIDIPEQPRDTTLDMRIRVRENSLRSIQTSVGFGIEELLRGQVSWTHRNAFNQGHKFTASGRASFIEQSVSLDYLFPYVFNTKSSVIISPFGQHLLEKSFELLRGGITNSFIYRYSENMTGSISYQYTKNQELSKQTDASLPDTTLQYDLSSLQVSGYYSQGFSREQRGWVVQPYAEVSGFLGGATFSFQKLSVDVRRYTELSKSTTLATRVQAGSLFSVDTDSLPNNIRFFLGGTNSVRGWYRQELGPKQARVRPDSVLQNDGTYRDTTEFVRYIPTGGRTMFGFNVEIRQSLDELINGFGVSAFLDGGQVWNKLSTVGNRPIQFGIGGGLRYRSPIGPLRIDVGYKVNPTKRDLNIYRGQDFGNFWNRIGIHFSIGQAF